ncbi:hypothetical protein [Rosettibacter firmus]|uniref:hypothetical protein n=1 Tax=Rosettibacter firmus TaxID=3111522 RepID=UPI00336BF09D
MKKNKELILRYLADLMDEKEKLEFENQLKVSEELKNEFDEISNILENFPKPEEIKLDERYFNTLLPKVYQKVSSVNKHLIRRIAYVIPVIITLLVYLFYHNSSENFDEQLQSLTQEMISYYNDSENPEYIEDITDEQMIKLQDVNNFDAAYLEELKIPGEYVQKYIPGIYEESQFLHNFTDDEIYLIYNNLDKFNITQVNK